MSGPRGPRGRRTPVAMAPTRTTRAIPTATPRRTALPVESAARRFTAGSHPSRVASPGRSHAEGTLGRLVDGVGAPRGPEHLGRRVHLDRGPLDLHGEPVHALGSRAELVLPGPVVLRPVAGAFEPLALLAERHPAPEVGALLIQGHQALVDEPRVGRVRGRPPEGFVVDDVEA